MELLDRVRATIRRHGLARPDTRVVVAVSGGPDSVALACVLNALHQTGDLTLAGLAHFNHHLRDDSSTDAAFCADLARALSLPFECGQGDVRALARRDGHSIEAAAHTARYTFLTEAAGRLNATRVALGHTRDDQAETVLLRLVRGAGSKGLAGMHPRHGLFIRPLLDLRRSQLRAYLDREGRAFRNDPTNDDPAIPRNRVRLVLVPLLEREFNPGIVDVLADAADVAREDWRWLRTVAEALLAASSEPDPAGWRVDAQAIAEAPRAVARVALRLLMERASGGRFIALRHVTAALDLCSKDRGRADVPGIRLERVGPAVVLKSRPPESRGRPAADSVNFFASPLSIPGEAAIEQAGCTVSAEVAPSAAGLERGLLGRGDMAVVPLSACTGMLTVRSRRPGDRLQLPGLTGHKKLQDLFVDRKVPRRLRERVPIVVDDRGRIVWVAGHSIAGEFRVTNPAQAVIILRLKLWGGSA